MEISGGVGSPVRTRLRLPIPCSTGIYREFSYFRPFQSETDQIKPRYFSWLAGKFPKIINREIFQLNREFMADIREKYLRAGKAAPAAEMPRQLTLQILGIRRSFVSIQTSHRDKQLCDGLFGRREFHRNQ